MAHGTWVDDEARFDAVLFDLMVIGEAVKKLPDEVLGALSPSHRSAPARLRDLIAHHYFALDAELVVDVVVQHLPTLLTEALILRQTTEG